MSVFDINVRNFHISYISSIWCGPYIILLLNVPWTTVAYAEIYLTFDVKSKRVPTQLVKCQDWRQFYSNCSVAYKAQHISHLTDCVISKKQQSYLCGFVFERVWFTKVRLCTWAITSTNQLLIIGNRLSVTDWWLI